ncbi:hypothetical protein PanWU01x14_157300 [Parasponia andersonii]|uniref:Major facilitator, sugar transporter-like n=1 Tax=Parasponia andersonii TaxID=3476 RepID=A0A2P5CFR5_PARAD|nr:hypothetical protein PanWU01x14_157300 [Parasponia andersonii]
MDKAKFRWYHLKAIVIIRMGFFIDAYDLFRISLVTKLLGQIYYHQEASSKPESFPPNVAATGSASSARLFPSVARRKPSWPLCASSASSLASASVVTTLFLPPSWPSTLPKPCEVRSSPSSSQFKGSGFEPVVPSRSSSPTFSSNCCPQSLTLLTP